MRRHGSRIPNVTAGLIATVLILAVCWLVFGGPTPFGGSPFVLHATYTAETQLHLDSPVRVAGVEVGKVTGVRRIAGSSGAALVTMAIQPNGLPIHADATTNIRPRLFLEGNFYVDLHPGSPAAPTLSSGATLGAAQNSGPVQLDRVLSSLNADSRTNLQTLLRGFGGALNGSSTPAQDATQDPSERGRTGAQALNDALKYSANAFRASSIVNEALLGESPHDLSGVVTGTSHLFGALAAAGSHLGHLVGSFNTTMGALAARQSDLQQTIALLPGVLRATDNALGPLQASFGPTRTFARELLPSIRQLDPTIGLALPWLSQSTALFSRTELGGLLRYLTPAIQGTSSTLTSTQSLLRGSDALARCMVHDVVPTGNERISDPPNTTGLQVYQELFQSAVGLASMAQNFDGNGRYVRSAVGGGSDREATGNLGSDGPLYGNAVTPTLGERPTYPGKAPAVNGSVACFTQAAPDLNK